jgi:hypothetical protein
LPPESLDAREYLSHLRSRGYKYHEPLAEYGLYDPFYKVSDLEASSWVNSRRSEYSDDYVIATAIAQDHMLSQFNPNPPHPRFYSTTDVRIKEALKEFFEETGGLYSVMEGYSLQKVQNFRHTRISWDCSLITATGETRKVLMSKYKR